MRVQFVVETHDVDVVIALETHRPQVTLWNEGRNERGGRDHDSKWCAPFALFLRFRRAT